VGQALLFLAPSFQARARLRLSWTQSRWEQVTRRSHTGIFIFVQNALIIQYSKKQNTVESATFGAEMVAMRIARDQTVALRLS